MWRDLKPIADVIIFQIQRLDKLITVLLIPPALPIPVSKQDCLDALESFHKRISAPIREHQTLIGKLSHHHLELQSLRQVTEEGGFEEFAQVRKELRKIDAFFASSQHWGSENINCIYSLPLEGQSDELKRWWREEAFDGSHVVKRQGQTRDPLLSRDPHYSLPAEIIHSIYSASSLETCCALRQVSRAWYAEFEQSHVMRQKLRLRNPWIKPGQDDLRSWQDCVLVFVARLKWPTTKKLDNGHVTRKMPETRLIRPKVLKLGETLPDSFEPMFDGSEHIHMYNGQHSFSVNVKSMDMTRTAHTVEYTGADKTVIKYKGIEIDVPSGFTPRWVTLEKNTIFVHADNGTILLPRDNPVWENAYLVVENGNHLFTAGSIGVVQTRDSYEFVDLESKQTVKYCNLEDARPMAVYNGAVWFRVKECLVPTFVDLETDTLYYNPDRIVTGVGVGLVSSGSRDLSHFVFINHREILNLVSGEKTEITLPSDWSWGVELFLGFFNGQFKAYCMSGEDVREMKAKMMEENAIPYDGHTTEEDDSEDEL